ncbi:MAG: molybdopterin-synthase adenylyltransferase MoeB [Alphaproteobacteria bacterium]|nr:molybdopterin-synthase adenylyltransferase MoeB [Alphaproteobacteria bacterium]
MINELSDQQIERYARHLILPEIGDEGQKKLLEARVLVVGAGGLGNPLLLYLAAAGIGKLGIIDDDLIDLSNLQRQILFDPKHIGQNKSITAKKKLEKLNPDIFIEVYPTRLEEKNCGSIIENYDIVADGSDNFATRYLVHDICFKYKKTLVSAALLKFDGQISTFKAYLGQPHPCYRCLFPEAPPSDMIPRCETAGIIGPIAGLFGTLQAIEIIKEITNIGTSLSGFLLIYDGLHSNFQKISFQRNPDCFLCSPSIK